MREGEGERSGKGAREKGGGRGGNVFIGNMNI
jgi:hypothetical protein